jgi:hypothetical protein
MLAEYILWTDIFTHVIQFSCQTTNVEILCLRIRKSRLGQITYQRLYILKVVDLVNWGWTLKVCLGDKGKKNRKNGFKSLIQNKD